MAGIKGGKTNNDGKAHGRTGRITGREQRALDLENSGDEGLTQAVVTARALAARDIARSRQQGR